MGWPFRRSQQPPELIDILERPTIQYVHLHVDATRTMVVELAEVTNPECDRRPTAGSAYLRQRVTPWRAALNTPGVVNILPSFDVSDLWRVGG